MRALRVVVVVATLAATALVAGGQMGWPKLTSAQTDGLLLTKVRPVGGLRFTQDTAPGTLSAVEAAEVVKGFSAGSLEELLNKLGTTPQRMTGDGPPAFAVSFGPQSGWVLLLDKEQAGNNYVGLQFYGAFKPTQKPNPTVINAWNKERRFTRAWLDDGETAALAMDMDLEKGVTKGAVEQAFVIFAAQFSRFVTYLQPAA